MRVRVLLGALPPWVASEDATAMLHLVWGWLPITVPTLMYSNSHPKHDKRPTRVWVGRFCHAVRLAIAAPEVVRAVRRIRQERFSFERRNRRWSKIGI